MKINSLVILLLFFFGTAASQSKQESAVIKNIDHYVSSIENDKEVKTQRFEVNGNGKLIKYEYKKKQNQIISISREWDEKNGAYIDHYGDYFILKNLNRVYASQSISYTNKSNLEDFGGWTCQFWFRNNKVLNMRSHGHGKTELDNWDYEKEMKDNFNYMMKTIKNFDKNLPLKDKK